MRLRPPHAAEEDKGKDQDDRHKLRPNAVAHDPVGVFAVEVAALCKATDADQQNDQNGRAGDGDDNEKRIFEHIVPLSVHMVYLV